MHHIRKMIKLKRLYIVETGYCPIRVRALLSPAQKYGNTIKYGVLPVLFTVIAILIRQITYTAHMKLKSQLYSVKLARGVATLKISQRFGRKRTESTSAKYLRVFTNQT